MANNADAPENEEKFIKAMTTNEEFRNALRDGEWSKVSAELDSLGIEVQDKDAVLDAIKKINWWELKTLENRLHKEGVHPMN